MLKQLKTWCSAKWQQWRLQKAALQHENRVDELNHQLHQVQMQARFGAATMEQGGIIPTPGIPTLQDEFERIEHLLITPVTPVTVSQLVATRERFGLNGPPGEVYEFNRQLYEGLGLPSTMLDTASGRFQREMFEDAIIHRQQVHDHILYGVDLPHRTVTQAATSRSVSSIDHNRNVMEMLGSTNIINIDLPEHKIPHTSPPEVPVDKVLRRLNRVERL